MQANFTEALEAVTEVNIYERLTDQLPAVCARRLFAAYRTLADVLDGLGWADEAAELRRQLDEATGGGTNRVDAIRTFTDDWIVGLSDLTLRVRKAAALAQTGHAARVHRLFPAEHVYPLTRTPDGLLSPGG
ncbi:hypothetical protein [Micromonospora wenchangensis]|uniref:hypothetical protein n=1 Tax=Micromonospora wenchangensis TaxID=1185415 RepID=UPI003D7560E4